jgi:hypothetical protein
MPDPALPAPRAAQTLPGRSLVERIYRDPLGRPLRGVVDVISQKPVGAGKEIIPASSGREVLTDGWLRVHLLPGRYLLKAQLTTADGTTYTHDDSVTVQA